VNLAKNGPGISLNSVLEVKYGTMKKRIRAIGIVQGVRMISDTAILSRGPLGTTGRRKREVDIV